MIYICENENDKIYPYILKGSWDQKIYCDKEELKKLKKDLEKLLTND